MKTKDIIRFKKNGAKQLILTRITEEQAREWCDNRWTRGKDWFDGFADTGDYCHNLTAKYNHYFIPDSLV